MKKLFFCIMSILMVITVIAQDKTFQSDKLTKIWESPNEFKTPESVCYNPGSQVLYVANINGKSSEKDGNGFISRLALDGKILELKWITGLNGPKGMGIYNGLLYVADIDRVAVIDINTKSVNKFYDFPEAQFLNDIAIDQNGAVYVSDSDSKQIYRILNDRAEVWLDDDLISGPNGLYVENDELMIGCDKIVLANLKDRKMMIWLEETGSIDGLESVGNGKYLVSDWSGNVYHVGNDKKIEKILDTSPAGINAADFEFIPEKRLLLVPTFRDNRVMAYEFKN